MHPKLCLGTQLLLRACLNGLIRNLITLGDQQISDHSFRHCPISGANSNNKSRL